MKNLGKRLIISISLLAIISLFNCGGVHAALQANNGTPATKGLEDWIVQIRQMETAGGTLGKSETINTTGLLATSESNGMDCHMEKNTEYGAMIILSASAYGKPTKVNNGETTTGNETGVKMNLNTERVSAGTGLTESTYAKNANGRYRNDYTNNSNSAKVGDAMNIGNWHGSGSTGWFNQTYDSGLFRAYSGSIFSYYGNSGENDHGTIRAGYKVSAASRAVIVIGENL